MATKNVQKISISLSQQQYDFIEFYQLEACYREAKASSDTEQDFDSTAADGIDDETW